VDSLERVLYKFAVINDQGEWVDTGHRYVQIQTQQLKLLIDEK